MKAGINPGRRDGGAAGPRVRAEGKSGVTECARSGLDADTRALGAANGIVDLPTGEVLPATEGRATRVRVAAPHEYRPWPEHSADARADGDRLCAHLEGHESDEWWASLAYARHGRPSRRFSLMRGGTGGGTPALVNALHAALGPYVSDPEPGALMVSRAVHETGLSPPRGAFVSPIRLALVDDVHAGVVETRLGTRLSGDGRITWRNLQAALRTDAATATIVCACHTGHVPRLSLHDAAVAARRREIPSPTVRSPDPDFGARMRPPARAAARLARVVQAAVHGPRHDAPPAETASVRVATAGRVDDDAGAWGLCARRVVPAGRFDTLSIQSVWRAGCEAGHDGAGHHQDVAGGIHRAEFPRRLHEVIPLPVAKQTKVDGRNVRAWYGWTLLDDAPAETSAPDAPVEREVVSRTFQRLGGGTGCPSLLVPVFLEEDTTTVCDRVTVTTADGTPVVVSKVAYRTMFKGSNAEFETAWESFGAPEDGAVDPKPLVVFHASVRRWPADPGPQLWTSALVQDEAHIDGAAGCGCATCWPARPPRSLALRVRDVEPRGGDALRGRALHPPPGAGRRARHARRSRVTPAPPDAPPTGEVCGDGVASVDDRYECAAGGRLSLGRPGAAPARRRIRAWRAPRPGLAVWSAWAARRAASGRASVAGGPRDRPRGCPRGGRGPCRRRVRRRRRAARRASHAPHPARR